METRKKHALLSASAADRWIACPPSARLCEQVPEEASAFAAEGTLAHSLAELKLSRLFTDRNMPDKTFKARHNKIKRDPLYQPEMEGFTDAYVDYVSEIVYGFPAAPYIAVEKQVSYGLFAPEGFGTADCIIIGGGSMHVVDFKYGKGVPVSDDGNRQEALYAIGAIEAYKIIYAVDTVTLHIVQPRLGNCSSWEVAREELYAWGEVTVRPAAELAFKGEGEYSQGGHCRFCRAAALCRKRAEENTGFDTIDAATGAEKLPPLLSDGEVGQILGKAQSVKEWVAKLERYALNRMAAGGKIPGWKLVEGRSNRVIADFDAAFGRLKETGYDEALLYDRKPITLTAVEKLVSKEDFSACVAPYIEKPPGAPTIAPETDSRPEYRPKPTAEESFGGTDKHKEENR